MRQLLFGASILAAVALVSCGESDSNAGSASTDTAAVSASVTPPTVPAAATTVDTGRSTSTTVDLKATVATPASGLNPPHGQPGHRCDIDVGAPLNSPPRSTTPSAPSAQSMPTGSQSVPIQVQSTPAGKDGFTSRPATVEVKSLPTGSGATAPAPTGSAPKGSGNMSGKINPPHGQPGHDCSVAVGQPLP